MLHDSEYLGADKTFILTEHADNVRPGCDFLMLCNAVRAINAARPRGAPERVIAAMGAIVLWPGRTMK